jgi:hypothetical protein
MITRYITPANFPSGSETLIVALLVTCWYTVERDLEAYNYNFIAVDTL